MTQVSIPYTHHFELHSETIGETFSIDIQTPDNDSKEPAPVIYLTDSNLMFPALASTIRLLQMGGELPNVVLVGIGYTNHSDVMALRTRDLTPTQDPAFAKLSTTEGGVTLPDSIRAGGADAFLDFMCNDVKPLVQSRFDVTDDETLVGFSLGGLFALHALFSHPTSFQRYLIGSPSLWWNKRMMFDVENAYAQKNKHLDASAFISIGSHEQPQDGSAHWARMVSNMHEFVEQLRARDYAQLQLAAYEFAEETHTSVAPATFSRGLRTLFSK